VDRPTNAPSPENPLLLAARYNDAEAEEFELADLFGRHGLELSEVEYLAQQRALRVVLIQSGRIEEIQHQTEPTSVSLSDAERDLMEAMVPLYVDAIFIGWRAKAIEDRAPTP
jgi:hypothetical protein